MNLHCGRFSLSLDRPRIMGILNVTPDSFSDGGRYLAPAAAVERAGRMHDEGADIIDIGGESTRPGAAPVPAQQELDRVLPVIEAVSSAVDAPISIDTSKPEVMRAAVRAGASMINDVLALRADGALEIAARLDVPVCLMHMQGEPRTMQTQPRYADVVGEVRAFLEERVAACVDAGIGRARLVVDPGFGFGKSLTHNLALLRRLDVFAADGLPVLAGLSRKSLFGDLLGRPLEQRLPGSLAAAVVAACHGASILRVHDVAATADALHVFAAARRDAGPDAG